MNEKNPFPNSRNGKGMKNSFLKIWEQECDAFIPENNRAREFPLTNICLLCYKHCKNYESCPSQVTWKVKFKYQICLSCLACLSPLSWLSWFPICPDDHDDHEDHDDNDATMIANIIMTMKTMTTMRTILTMKTIAFVS